MSSLELTWTIIWGVAALSPLSAASEMFAVGDNTEALFELSIGCIIAATAAVPIVVNFI